MLNQISLRLFKCFENIDLCLAPLTLLSGQNSSGKSTIIQALVLLHQTMNWQEWSSRLLLNGEEIQLGTVSDVVDAITGRDTIGISLGNEKHVISWTFSGDRNDMSMEIRSVKVGEQIYARPPICHFLFPHDHLDIAMTSQVKGLTYLSAERLGPRPIYALSDRYSYNGVGAHGEYAATRLFRLQNKDIHYCLLLNDIKNTLGQTRAWMRAFFPESDIALTPIPEANCIRLGMRTSNETNFHRPINVGFGMTQVFPIIVAILTAEEGDIVIVENPEVHLHPAGQALMGEFLARAANAGIQIIIESHSDHILNGIRKSIKQRTISCDKVAIHFFKARGKDSSQAFSLKVNSDGNLDMWPKDFFDQFDKDMNYFAGWND